MIIGYARVSTKDQKLDLQIEALENAGCEMIYQEKISGSTKLRPQLDEMLKTLREGDTVVVWKLDRLGRSLINIITLVLSLSERKIIVRGLTDSVDTSTSSGRMLLGILAVLAEYERELIRERTNAGLKIARTRGRLGGRPKGLKADTVAKLKIMRKLVNKPDTDTEALYMSLGLTRATFYRYWKILDNNTDEQLNDLIIKKKRK